ncbi:MAG TPA: hypothetical protein VKM55_27380 [Candidatus Lokiarchaeia archaeon]|nr:hypothetical protein [Candidatus Lokiarchaeia archaeon]
MARRRVVREMRKLSPPSEERVALEVHREASNEEATVAKDVEELRQVFRDLGRDIDEADARESVAIFSRNVIKRHEKAGETKTGNNPHDVNWWYCYIQERDPDLLVPHDNTEVMKEGEVIARDEVVYERTPAINTMLPDQNLRDHGQIPQDLGCVWGMAGWHSDIEKDEQDENEISCTSLLESGNDKNARVNFSYLNKALEAHPKYQDNVPTKYQGYEKYFQQTSPGHYVAIAKEGKTYVLESDKYRCILDGYLCSMEATMKDHITMRCIVNINEIALQAQENIGILNPGSRDFLAEIVNGMDPHHEKDALYGGGILTFALPTDAHPDEMKAFLETRTLPPSLDIETVKSYQKKVLNNLIGSNGVRHATEIIQLCLDEFKDSLASLLPNFDPEKALAGKPKVAALWDGMPIKMQQELQNKPWLAANMALERRQLLGITGRGERISGDLQLVLYNGMGKASTWQIEVKGGMKFDSVEFTRSTLIQALNGRLENEKIGAFSLLSSKDMQFMSNGMTYKFNDLRGIMGRISLGSRLVYARLTWLTNEKEGSRMVIEFSKTVNGLDDATFQGNANELSSEYVRGVTSERFFTSDNRMIEYDSKEGADPMKDPRLDRGVMVIPEPRTIKIDFTSEAMRAENLVIMQQFNYALGLPIDVRETGWPAVSDKAYADAETCIGSLFAANCIEATNEFMEVAKNEFGWLGLQKLPSLLEFDFSAQGQEYGKALQDIFNQIQASGCASLTMLGPNSNQLVEYHSNMYDEVGGFDYMPTQSWWGKPGYEDYDAYGRGIIQAGKNGKFIEFEVDVKAIPSVDGSGNEYHEIEALGYAFKGVDELLRNINEFVSNCSEHGFQVDRFALDLNNSKVINFKVHYIGNYGSKSIYETTGSFNLLNELRLHITRGIGSERVSVHGEPVTYGSLLEYINKNNLEDPRVFAFFNMLNKEYHIVPPGCDSGNIHNNTIHGATVRKILGMDNCYEVHYPFASYTDKKTARITNKADLPIICDLSKGEVNVYCLKTDSIMNKPIKGAWLARGPDIKTAVRQISNFAEMIDSYSIGTHRQFGFKICEIQKNPSTWSRKDHPEWIQGFLVNPEDGSAMITLKLYNFARENPYITYEATADLKDHPRLISFTIIDTAGNRENVPVSYLDRAFVMYRAVKGLDIAISKFNISSEGVSIALGRGRTKDDHWFIKISMPAYPNLRNRVLVSRIKGETNPSVDAGALDNAIHYIYCSTRNPYTHRKTPCAMEIETKPMFFIDKDGNQRFMADLSPIGLGRTNAKQNSKMHTWEITNEHGTPIQLDDNGNPIGWPSMMAYMEITHYGWTVKCIENDYAKDVDRITLTVSKASDHKPMDVDIYYNHSLSKYRIGDISGNDYSQFTLFPGLKGIIRRH